MASGGHARGDERGARPGGWDGVGREAHTCVCRGHTSHRKSTTKGTFNLGGRGRKWSEVSEAAAPYLVFCKRKSRDHRAGEKAQGPIPEVEATPHPHPLPCSQLRPHSGSPGATGGGGSCPSQGETKSRGGQEAKPDWELDAALCP